MWLFLLVLAFVSGEASRPALKDMSLTLDGKQVLVTMELRNAFDQDLQERIDSGLPTELLYEVKLLRDRKRWWDRRLDRTRIQVVAMYDAVAREYLVNLRHDGKLIASRMAKDSSELERAMTRLETIPLFNLPDLPPGTRLLVRGRAILGSRTRFRLVPTRVTTEWVDSRKIRTP
jgi:hypothetical protein